MAVRTILHYPDPRLREKAQPVAAVTPAIQELVDDIRPGIEQLAVVDTTAGGVLLEAVLATQPRGLRPAELVIACYPGVEAARVVRTAQWIEQDRKSTRLNSSHRT